MELRFADFPQYDRIALAEAVLDQGERAPDFRCDGSPTSIAEKDQALQARLGSLDGRAVEDPRPALGRVSRSAVSKLRQARTPRPAPPGIPGRLKGFSQGFCVAVGSPAEPAESASSAAQIVTARV